MCVVPECICCLPLRVCGFFSRVFKTDTTHTEARNVSLLVNLFLQTVGFFREMCFVITACYSAQTLCNHYSTGALLKLANMNICIAINIHTGLACHFCYLSCNSFCVCSGGFFLCVFFLCFVCGQNFTKLWAESQGIQMHINVVKHLYLLVNLKFLKN